MLAVIFGLEKFRPFLLEHPFTLITDNMALVWLFTKKSKRVSRKLERWKIMMLDYTYDV